MIVRSAPSSRATSSECATESMIATSAPLGGLHLDVRPLSPAQAFLIGDLRPGTKSLGLSLGDRACLALAIDLHAELFTTDAALASVAVGIDITDVRRSAG